MEVMVTNIMLMNEYLLPRRKEGEGATDQGVTLEDDKM